jgi:hypothetical protein
MEISLCMASLVTLEGGLKEASRYGITSQTPTAAQMAAIEPYVPDAFASADNRTKQIMAILNRSTLDLINLDTATISTSVYGSFSAVKDGEPYSDVNGNGIYDAGETYSDMNCNGSRDAAGAASAGVGVSGNIVVYTVNYNWQVLTPIVGEFLGEPDPDNVGRYRIPMTASIVVKNEPNLSGSSFCK